MATKEQREAFAGAVKSLLFQCGQLGRLPDELSATFGQQEVDEAVEAIRANYSRQDTPGFRPVLIQALVALRDQGGNEERVAELVDLLTEDANRRRSLKDAPDASAFRTELRNLNVTPAMFEDVCQFFDVTVGGTPAVYIYSEFSSSVSFAQLTGWLEPENWPDRAPLLFREVTHTTDRATERWQQFNLWHQRFREEATPFDDVVVNFLSCDNASRNDFAVTAYDLDTKAVQGVRVDRGYLLVTDLGAVRIVKFVKIIGFNDPEENQRVYELRPFWMSWLRAVAEGEPETRADAQVQAAEPPPSAQELNVGDLVLQWADAFSSVAGACGQLTGRLVQGVSGPQFDWNDYRRLLANYWGNAVRPYAVAFTNTQRTFEQMAGPQATGPAGFQTAAASKAASMAAKTTLANATLPLAATGRPLSTQVDVSEMRSISNASMVIPPGHISARLTGTEAQPRLSLTVDPRGYWPGVYIGSARVGGEGATIPAFLFIADSVAA